MGDGEENEGIEDDKGVREELHGRRLWNWRKWRSPLNSETENVTEAERERSRRWWWWWCVLLRFWLQCWFLLFPNFWGLNIVIVDNFWSNGEYWDFGMVKKNENFVVMVWVGFVSNSLLTWLITRSSYIKKLFWIKMVGWDKAAFKIEWIMYQK